MQALYGAHLRHTTEPDRVATPAVLVAKAEYPGIHAFVLGLVRCGNRRGALYKLSTSTRVIVIAGLHVVVPAQVFVFSAF